MCVLKINSLLVKKKFFNNFNVQLISYFLLELTGYCFAKVHFFPVNNFNVQLISYFLLEHWKVEQCIVSLSLVIIIYSLSNLVRVINMTWCWRFVDDDGTTLVLCMPTDRRVRCARMAPVSGSVMYPTGSLFSDCPGVALPQLVASLL